ncbi:MAG: hypothetical protein WCW13_01490 [archaeon]|jgi:hypothetical protein
MKQTKILLILIFILILSFFAFADDNSFSQPTNTQTTQNNSQPEQIFNNQPQNNPQQYNTQPQQPQQFNNNQKSQPYNNQNQQSNNNQQNNSPQDGMMQPQSNFGMPSSSSADPEYVAQQKMVEGMTTAYNWISLNTTHFSEGCKANKDDLIKEITGVVQNSTEASNICQRFSAEVTACDPELFCTTMRSGNLPLPPQTKSTMKKLGYNPDTMKAQDITQDLIIKVCIEQASSDLATRAEMVTATKKSIQDQIPKFRASCEEYKKNSNQGQNMQLPTFNFPTQQYAPGTGPNQPGQQQGRVVQQNQNPQQMQNPMQQQNPQQQNQNPPQGQQPIGPEQNVCNSQAPNCDAGPAPFCENGNWVCPQTNNPQGQQTPQQQNQTPSTTEQTVTTTTDTNPTTETTTPPQPTTEATPTQSESAAPSTTPATEGGGETPTVQTIVATAINKSISGLFGIMFEGTQAVCGNGMCEPDLGENQQNCPKDCTPNQNNQDPNSAAGQMNPNQPNQSRGPGSGMSPQQLCTLTDDEIVAEYMGNMESNLTLDKQRNEYRCKQESTNTLNEISRYNLESAKCLADAALDCESKRQAVATCNEMQNSPETIATMIVNNMCLRFISKDTTKNNKLLTLAAEFNQADPALASQLSDTSEKNIADQKSLNIVSYLFGDGNYAQKLKERTDKLIIARDRLASKQNADDKDVLDMLDAQIADLKSESEKFSNAFDITRIGYLFGR